MTRVTVKVVDNDTGAPFAGAEVAILGTIKGTDAGFQVRGETDTLGTCSLTVPLAEGQVAILCPIVRARGRREWRETWEKSLLSVQSGETGTNPEIVAGGTAEFDVALLVGKTIEGVVRDEDGEPVLGAEIGLVLSGPNWCGWPYAFEFGEGNGWPPGCTTDEGGRFEWLSFPAEKAVGQEGSRWVLTVEHPFYRPLVMQAVERIDAGDQGVIRINAVLRKGVVLQGIVKGPDGRPCARATVTLEEKPRPDQPVCVSFKKEGRTDGHGRFVLQGLARTMYLAEVVADGCAPFREKLDLQAGPLEELAVHLEPGSTLAGTVLDAEGAPARDTEVLASMLEPRLFRRVRTDDHGRFRIAGLPVTGQVKVRIGNRLATSDN
jgi:hypothetical protein